MSRRLSGPGDLREYLDRSAQLDLEREEAKRRQAARFMAKWFQRPGCPVPPDERGELVAMLGLDDPSRVDCTIVPAMLGRTKR
jgi:hypothetical protein